MALAGHDTAYLVINDPATAGVYSGTLNGVVAGERIVVTVAADGNSNAQDPSTWTVTLGSDTLGHVVSNTTTLVEGFTAIFAGTATTSGNLTLTVDPVNQTRALTAHAFRITGFDTASPHPNFGQNMPGANATSLTSPNAVSTAANNNAIIGVISIHGGDITGLAVGAADGSTTGNNGGSAFNDNTWGVAWDRTPTAGPVTFAWTWTVSDRPGASWIEIAEAAASGSTGTSAGASTVSASGQAQASASGSSAGVATASAAMAATGSATGSSTASGASSGAISGAGTAAGSASANGVGAVLATSAGAATGSSAVSAAKWSDVDWSGAPAYWGDESATWTPGAASVATGTAAGIGAATAQGAAIATAAGVSAGTSSATGAPNGIATGAGTSAGTASVVGAGGSTATVIAAAFGTSGATAAGGAASVATGVASGASSVVATGGAIVIAAGAANGSSTAAGTANGASIAVGAAAGSVTVSGVGGSVAIAAGSAAGSCVVTAVGGDISDAPRRVALASESRNGVIILTPANGVSLLNIANGA